VKRETPGQGVCERGDSNPHGLPHRDLNPARLPVPPRSRAASRAYNSVPQGPVPRRGWRDGRSGWRSDRAAGPALLQRRTGREPADRRPAVQGATRQRRRRKRTSDTTPATIARNTATITTITTKTQIHSGPGIARLLRLVADGSLGSNLPSELIRAASFYPATGSGNRARLLTGARPGRLTRPGCRRSGAAPRSRPDSASPRPPGAPPSRPDSSPARAAEVTATAALVTAIAGFLICPPGRRDRGPGRRQQRQATAAGSPSTSGWERLQSWADQPSAALYRFGADDGPYGP
jgi:hypothetical protein